jgi:hypothetical protein
MAHATLSPPTGRVVHVSFGSPWWRSGWAVAGGWTALVVVALPASVAAGELAKAMLGYPGLPLAAMSFEFVVPVLAAAMIAFALPCTAAWTYGLRSLGRGDPWGWVPLLASVVAVTAYLALDLAPLTLR